MSIKIAFQDHEADIVAKAKTYTIAGLGWQDIAQEFRILIWQKGHLFNPERSSERTFVNRIISNKLKDLAKYANAEKRKFLNYSLSLEELREKEEVKYNNN